MNLTCRKTRALFDDRLDGRLAAAPLAAFDRHLAECADCRREWTDYQAAWDLVGQQTTVAPSFGFAERTMRRLAAPPAKAPLWNWRRSWRWAWLGAALVAVAFAGWQVHARVIAARRAALYAMVQQQEYLEDFDVIASLDQLAGAEARCARGRC